MRLLFALFLLSLCMTALGCRDASNENTATDDRATPAAEQPPPHIVFVTGDEEYRSEESMPMLARILKRDYGFRVTVCYALDEQGVIDPNNLENIEGLEALEEADMMVLFTRFRALPEEQRTYILDFAESGKPMAGFRTATHAFLYSEALARLHGVYDEARAHRYDEALAHLDEDGPRKSSASTGSSTTAPSTTAPTP